MGINQVAKISDLDSKLKALFIEYADSLSIIGKNEGVCIAPYSSSNLVHFDVLQIQEKQKVVEGLKNYLEICQQTILSGHSVKNSKQLTWNALKKFKLRPHLTLFDHLNDGQVIEFYSSENIQIFRNFVFFELCSYTLEDVYCRPWFELYKRDDSVTAEILKEFEFIFKGQSETIVSSKTPKHYLFESSSFYSNTVEMQVDFCAPLYSDSKNEKHLIVAESCRLISSNFQKQQVEHYPDL